MYVEITAAGYAALNANKGPVEVTTFKVGASYGWVPDSTTTDIKGPVVYTGEPTQYLNVTPNVVKYTTFMDATVGPFTWGEMGFYLSDGTCFAVAVSSTPMTKNIGDSSRSDVFLSMVESGVNNINYAMWLSLAESNNPFHMATLGAPDQLPASADATPNCYIISGYQDDQVAFMAYTNRQGWWSFDAYDYASAAGTETTVQAVDSTSISIANADFQSYMNPTSPGSVILEVVSGAAYSYCRYVTSVVVGPSLTTLNFASQWATQPAVGDQVVFFVRRGSAGQTLATTTTPGSVIVGSGLDVGPDGTISVDPSQIQFPVTSFNGKQGAVTYQVMDQNSSSGLTLITDSGLSDGTGQFRRLVAGPNIQITTDQYNNLVLASSLSFSVGHGLTDINGVIAVDESQLNFPVTSVNGKTGAVTFQVTDNDPVAADGYSLVRDTGLTTNVAKLTRLVGGQGIILSTDVNNNLIITNSNNVYTLPTASATTLGGVKVGSGLTINAQGVLSVAFTQTVVNGQTGNVTIEAINASGATGQTLIANSGATNGIIQLYTLKAGSGTTITQSGGDVTISSAYTLPIAGTYGTGPLGGVMADGTTVTVNAQGVLTAHVDPSTIPFATTTTAGKIIVGQTLTINTSTGVLDYNLPIAGVGAGGVLGGVKVDGTTVTVNPSTGVISAAAVVPIATTTSLGAVQVGNGLSITAGGVLSVSGAVTSFNTLTGAVTYSVTNGANSTGSVGLVETTSNNGATIRQLVPGSNITVTTDTNGNAVIASTASGNVTSVNTLTGAVTVSAGDTSTASGTTLITDSGATNGTIRIRRLVAGSGIALGTDGNNNLTITSSVTGGVTSVSSQTGAVVVSAVDTSTASGTTLISDSGSTTGTIKIKRVVAGTGITVANDGNGNLQVSASSSGAQFYDVQAGVPGTLIGGQILGQTPAVRTIVFPANFASSVAYAGITAAASAVITVAVWTSGSSSTVGTITFAAGSNTGTFTTTGGTTVTVSPGSVIIFTGPATADTNLGNVSITLFATAT